MNLQQLTYLVALDTHRQFGLAAEKSCVSQPALSVQVQKLEEELGAQLLHRSAQGVLSTDAGKVFYEHAQAILKQVGDAKTCLTRAQH